LASADEFTAILIRVRGASGMQGEDTAEDDPRREGGGATSSD
jgi:hypothetical protein